MNRRLECDLAAGHFVIKHEDALFLGPPGTGKSHLAQAIGRTAIQQGHKVLYREAHVLLEELADATIAGKATTPTFTARAISTADLASSSMPRVSRAISATLPTRWRGGELRKSADLSCSLGIGARRDVGDRRSYRTP